MASDSIWICPKCGANGVEYTHVDVCGRCKRCGMSLPNGSLPGLCAECSEVVRAKMRNHSI